MGKRKLVIAALIVAGGIAWYAFRPERLFVNKTVSESLPTAASAALPVIVVSRVVDIDLYLTTLESGASDFIVPPFSAADLAYLLDTAIRKGRAASA